MQQILKWQYWLLFFLNLGRSSRGGRQKLILEIIAKLLLLLNEEIKVA